jgi:hypothetical protein
MMESEEIYFVLELFGPRPEARPPEPSGDESHNRSLSRPLTGGSRGNSCREAVFTYGFPVFHHDWEKLPVVSLQLYS